MDNDNKIVPPTAEELAAEQAATAEVKENEIRAEIITEYGFDETADAERIDKLTKKEVESRKKLSSAIGQKIKHRNKADELSKKVPVDTKVVTPPADDKKKDDLSQKDLVTLIEAKIPSEDYDEVVKASKLLGKSISETIKDPLVVGNLERRAEERDSANAANTGGSRRTTVKQTDESVIGNLSKGIIPEKGSPEAEQLFRARRKR